MEVFWLTFSSLTSLLSLIEAMNSLEFLFPCKKDCPENEIKLNYFSPVFVTEFGDEIFLLFISFFWFKMTEVMC